jgi:aminoglycoside/choline kinase family phosphotransferase
MGERLDARFDALCSWISQVADLPDQELKALSGDASFRRYFRVGGSDGRSYVVIDAPPERYDAAAFMRIAERFYCLGINVPQVFQADPERGFFVVTDFGDQCYLAQLNESTAERLYDDAMRALQRLQGAGRGDENFLPAYDQGLLLAEMRLFREWYLERHLQLSLNAHHTQALDATFDWLAGEALAQPRVWVHRDYHSRNLMVTAQHNPGILDFQDAVCGPVAYDLVSLLRACYIAWPRAHVERWVQIYRDRAGAADIPVGATAQEFLRWFDLIGVQRHLKAIGIFARLKHRDHKPHYLADIPRTLAYVLAICTRYSELRPLRRLLQELGLAEGIGQMPS